MADLAVLAIQIDSSGAKKGAEETAQALEKVKGAAASSSAAIAGLSPIQQQLVASYDRLRQQLKAGTIGFQEYQAQQNALLQQLQRSTPVTDQVVLSHQRLGKVVEALRGPILGEVHALRQMAEAAQAAGAQNARLADLRTRLQQAAVATQQAAQATALTAPATQTAADGWTKLRGPIQTVLFSMSGVPGTAGRAASALALFAGGGGLALAVAAGIAAIAFAFRKLTEDSRVLAEGLKASRAALEEAGKPIELRFEVREELTKLEVRLPEIRQRLAELQVPGGGRALAGEQQALNKSLERYNELLRLTGQLERELRDVRAESRQTAAATATALLQARAPGGEAQVRAQLDVARLDVARAPNVRALSEALTRKLGLERALNEVAATSIRFQSALREVDRQRTDALREFTGIQDGGLAGQIRVQRALKEEQDALRIGAGLWQGYTAGLVESLEKHLTFEEALARGSVHAKEFAAEARDVAAVLRQVAEAGELANEVFRLQQQLLPDLRGIADIRGVRPGEQGTNRPLIQRPPSFRDAGEGSIEGVLEALFGKDYRAREAAARDAANQRVQAELELMRVQNDLRVSAVQLARDMGALPGAAGEVADTIVRLIASLKELNEAEARTTDVNELAAIALQRTAAKISAVANIAASILPATGVGGIGRSVIGGAASGAIAGSVIPGIGTIAGGIIGGATGLISGILGFGKAAAEEARRLREARKDWDEAFEGWARIGVSAAQEIRERLGNEFEKWAEDLLALFPDLQSGIKLQLESFSRLLGAGAIDPSDVLKSIENLRNAGKINRELAEDYIKLVERYKAAQEEANRQREVEVRLLGLETGARLASLQGREAEAETIRLLITQEQELEQLRQQYADELPEAIRLQLEQIHLLEREKLARDQAIRAMEKEAEASKIESDITLREIALRGDARATEEATIRAHAAAQQAQAELDLATGKITQTQFIRLTNVIQGELTQALNEATQAAQDAATAIQEQIQANIASQAESAAAITQDILRRNLKLKGDERSLIILDNMIEREEYLRRARELGLPEETIQSIIDLFNDELAAAFKKLNEEAAATAKAVQDAADAFAAAQLTFSQDLQVRYLEATGQGGIADSLRLQFEQERERNEAIAEGFSAATIAFLDVVHAAERQAFQQQQAEREAKAQRETQKLSIGGAITEATGSTIAGYLASANVYLREISYNTASFRGGLTIPPAQNVAAINTGGGGTAPAGGLTVQLSFTFRLNPDGTLPVEEILTKAVPEIRKELKQYDLRDAQAAGRPRIL